MRAGLEAVKRAMNDEERQVYIVFTPEFARDSPAKPHLCGIIALCGSTILGEDVRLCSELPLASVRSRRAPHSVPGCGGFTFCLLPG